jgi:hypothetical protein
MALSRLTQINAATSIQAGVTTTLYTAVGIYSGGQSVGTGITYLNFVGTGNTFLDQGNGIVDISIAGGSAANASGGVQATDSLDRIAFIHYGGFTSDASVKSPQKFNDIFTHVDATVDIDSGVTVSVDNDCLLRITDKIDYDINYFAPQDSNETMLSEVNSLRATGFDDNIRTTFASDGELNTTKKVGYVKLPHDLEDEIMIDIESGVTISIGDMCVLII